MAIKKTSALLIITAMLFLPLVSGDEDMKCRIKVSEKDSAGAQEENIRLAQCNLKIESAYPIENFDEEKAYNLLTDSAVIPAAGRDALDLSPVQSIEHVFISNPRTRGRGAIWVKIQVKLPERFEQEQAEIFLEHIVDNFSESIHNEYEKYRNSRIESAKRLEERINETKERVQQLSEQMTVLEERYDFDRILYEKINKLQNISAEHEKLLLSLNTEREALSARKENIRNAINEAIENDEVMKAYQNTISFLKSKSEALNDPDANPSPGEIEEFTRRIHDISLKMRSRSDEIKNQNGSEKLRDISNRLEHIELETAQINATTDYNAEMLMKLSYSMPSGSVRAEYHMLERQRNLLSNSLEELLENQNEQLERSGYMNPPQVYVFGL